VISRNRLFGALCTTACLGIATLATPALAAEPAWSPVAASGPTNLPPVQNEIQRLAVDAEGGTFTLTAHHVAARGTGDPVSSSQTITNVVTASGAFAVGQGIEGTGVPADTTIIAVGGGTLTISNPVLAATGGSGVALLATDAIAETTPPLAFDAEAAEVEAALNALGLINTGGGSVSVRGGPGNKNSDHPYFISFDGGALADTDAPQLSVNSAGLISDGTPNAVISTTVPGGLGTTRIALYAQNVGGLATSGTITVKVELPSGVTTSTTPGPLGFGAQWTCTTGAGQQSFTCTNMHAVPPGSVAQPILAPVVSDADASGTKSVEVSVEGGGAETASYSMPLTVSAAAADPGVQAFTAGAYDEDGKLDTRAGGHPYSASTAILVNTYRNGFGNVVPVGEFKDINVDLPPGFLGNPVATPQCPEVNLANANSFTQYCPTDAIIGSAGPLLTNFGNSVSDQPVYNVEAPFGYPGKFFFQVLEEPIHAVGSLRSDEDYGLTVSSLNTAQIATIFGSFFTFWGTPADPAHDSQRCNGTGCAAIPVPSTAPETAFLTSPVDCAREALEPPITRLRVSLWQSPLASHEASVPIEPVTGCENLHFEADFTFEPSETKSDSPASFRTSLTVPSEGLTDPEKLTTPEIRKTVVQLPKGVVLNASGADGLDACSESEIGLKNAIEPATGLPKPETMPNPVRFDKEPNTCPDSSKIGTGELKSALLEEALHGDLYLAAQGKGNPFGTLFAVYLVIEDPRHGIVIKLPGKVDPDPVSGQMTVSFENLPQLPFTYLRLGLKGGNRSVLATPTTCGQYVTAATNTPWSAPESGPPTESANNFEINQGPNGLPCAPSAADRPFDVGWKAGGESITAGASGPFDLQITRPDGSQELESLELTAPPGVTATLRGIPYCSEAQISAAEASNGKAEQATPACPAASQVGTTEVGAGSGPTPFYTPGKLYLAGPYKGAPISLVAVTPAVAGPFDLGNVVVRSAVHVNPETAQITAKTDPIPQILKGVVLRVRDLRIHLNHRGWTINPTSCDPKNVSLTAHGNSGAVGQPSVHFQVGGCGALRFQPKLHLKLKGGTRRNDYPALTATLTQAAGQANIGQVAVRLPHSEFLEQGHIRTICTRVQFAARECPAASIYGHAEAITPLLDEKLSGPVYLRSSNHELPDLVAALRGPAGQPIEIDLDGRVDSVHGGIRNSFEVVPDAPVSKFTLRLQGGKKGLIVNSANLCALKARARRATVRLIGQNNKRADQYPLLQNQCGKKHKHHHKSHKQRESVR
jgi:hypothetical protein